MKISMRQARASLICIALMGAGAPTFAQAQAAEEADSAETDEIVVTGRRAALQAAQDRKKNASTIVDSVVADEAGKLPDNSITEVLQRVAGVTIVRFAALNDPDHFSVEGSGIQVRGLSGVASRLNGREIFSANAGRSLLWGDVTPELMAAVDVYKSASADQIEGGTGGSVDLRTKLPFDYDYGWHFAGSTDTSIGDLARETDYSFSGLIAGKWSTGIGDIGILLDGAYSQLTSNSHFFRMEPYYRTSIGGEDYFLPGGYDFGEQHFQRKRDGIYAAVQWEPSDSLKLTGIFFQSRYRNAGDELAAFVTSQQLSVDPSVSTFDSNNMLISSPSLFNRDPATFLPNGNAINSGGTTGVNRSRSKTQDMSLAVEWAPVGSRLSANASVQHINSTSVADSMSVFRDFAFPTSFGLDVSGDLPVVTTPEGADYTDPSRYFWSAAMPHNERNRGEMDAVQLDLKYEMGEGFFKSVKAGGRWAKRTERDLNNGFSWTALGRGWNGDSTNTDPNQYAPQLTFANAAPGDVTMHTFRNFFHDQVSVPSMLFPSHALAGTFDPDLIHRAPPTGFCGPFDWGNSTYFNCSSAGPLPVSGYGGLRGRPAGFVLPIDQVDFSTETLAGYVMTSFGAPVGSGDISGNAGVRVVHVKNRSDGYVTANSQDFVYPDADGDTYRFLSGAFFRSDGAEFTRVLPAVNISYKPSEPFRLRAAYNITMDLPSFQALRASGSLGIQTVDNPNNPPPPAPGEQAQPNLPPVLTGFTGNTGDPTLKPAMSNNFDLSFEWYPRAGSALHVAAFYKRLKNLPLYSLAVTPVTLLADDGTPISAPLLTTEAHNADEAATVKGFEVGGRWFFDQLPGLLRGLGIEANYTHISSKNPGDLYRDIDGVEHNDAPLQGLSKHNYNVSLLYEHSPFSVRVAYSWRSKYLQSTNANGTTPTYIYYSAPGVQDSRTVALPVYGAAYGTLDAGVTIKATENFSFSIEGSNLTNSTAKTLMGGYPNGALPIRSWFQSDRRLKVGVNLSF